MATVEYKNKFEKYMPSLKFPEVRGTALQIGVMKGKGGDLSAVVEMAKQNKERVIGKNDNIFDWKTKTLMALGAADIGPMLAYITGYSKNESCKIIHKYPTDGPADQQRTTTLELAFSEKGDLAFKLAQKKPGEKEFTNSQIYLTPGETYVLKTLLEHLVLKIYSAFDV